MKTWFEYDRDTGAVLRQFRLPENMPSPSSEDGHGIIESPEFLTFGKTASVVDGAVQIAEDTPVAPSLNDLKADRWNLAKSYRDKVMAGTCSTPSGTVQIDDVSKLKINGAVNMAMLAKQAGSAFTIDWTMADNSVVTLDADGMIGVGVAVGQYIAACQDAGTAIRAQIDTAADPNALAAIDITAGYPS